MRQIFKFGALALVTALLLAACGNLLGPVDADTESGADGGSTESGVTIELPGFGTGSRALTDDEAVSSINIYVVNPSDGGYVAYAHIDPDVGFSTSIDLSGDLGVWDFRAIAYDSDFQELWYGSASATISDNTETVQIATAATTLTGGTAFDVLYSSHSFRDAIVTDTSVMTYVIATAPDATIHYDVAPAGGPAPTAEDLVTTGEMVSFQRPIILAEGLTPNTDYTLYFCAKDGAASEETSPVYQHSFTTYATAEVVTLQGATNAPDGLTLMVWSDTSRGKLLAIGGDTSSGSWEMTVPAGLGTVYLELTDLENFDEFFFTTNPVTVSGTGGATQTGIDLFIGAIAAEVDFTGYSGVLVYEAGSGPDGGVPVAGGFGRPWSDSALRVALAELEAGTLNATDTAWDPSIGSYDVYLVRKEWVDGTQFYYFYGDAIGTPAHVFSVDTPGVYSPLPIEPASSTEPYVEVHSAAL